jgi:hypothetical protein
MNIAGKQMHILSRFGQTSPMIKDATIIRPARMQGLYATPCFIPSNSKDQLIEVDMGFRENPLFKQEKLIYFIPENIYYQKLAIADGKANFIKDDARAIVISGNTGENDLIPFNIEIYPSLPAAVNINRKTISLPFYPELNTEIVVRDTVAANMFYHFSCYKIIYKTGALPYLQLRCLGSYNHGNLATVLRKWHPAEIKSLENIPQH